MFTERQFDILGVDMIASNDSEESMEKFSSSIGGGKYQTAITDLGKALLQAARIGNTEKVHELMSRGAPFTADWLGTTPLHLAARYNHLETCKVLLRAGISKDSKTKVERTPLHLAAYNGHIEVVELLLSNKCEVDARDMLKMTALHWAVQMRHDKVVEMLLQHGSDPNALSKFDRTPIRIATDTGQMELVRLLLLANQMRAASSEQVQEATDGLMYELQQHKERHLGAQPGAADETAEVEDNITMDLSNDSSSHLSPRSGQHRLDDAHDPDNLIEKEDSLSDAITNLEQSTDADPQNRESTLQMLKEHGISYMPPDDTGSVITSAIRSGRKIVLSEAGKFALKETRNLHPPVQTAPLQVVAQPPKAKTIKFIKKQSSTTGGFGASVVPSVVPSPQQPPNAHHVHQPNAGATPTLKTNKVIKILSAEEFHQICSGEVRSIKRVPSAEYKKAVTTTTAVRVPITNRPHVIPVPGGGVGAKQISKFVMTKSGQRIPVLTTASKPVAGEIVPTKLGSIPNGLSTAGHNRHIITSADGVKRLRTSAGMEIISALPTKLPQDTVVSVESSPTAARLGSVYQRVSTIGQPAPASAGPTGTTNTLIVEVIERQMLELKKLVEDLRKQFELSQKQNEEYRARIEKLEKEVQTLKQGSTANSLVELI